VKEPQGRRPALSEPRIDRPRIPREYGVPRSRSGLLGWDHVDRRLREATVYWVATSGPDGRPRVRPVDGIWLDGVLYVGGSPETRWVQDLLANGQVAVHLDGSSDVVILEGTAAQPAAIEEGLAERLAEASNAKYPQYGVTAADYLGGMRPFVIRVQKAVAWTSFPRDVTRFTFPTAATRA
jgi:hypothetical protein